MKESACVKSACRLLACSVNSLDQRTHYICERDTDTCLCHEVLGSCISCPVSKQVRSHRKITLACCRLQAVPVAKAKGKGKYLPKDVAAVAMLLLTGLLIAYTGVRCAAVPSRFAACVIAAPQTHQCCLHFMRAAANMVSLAPQLLVRHSLMILSACSNETTQASS